ncbi:MAG: MBL fold metallo-hydrolase [Desulfurococcaceae archaeon]
MSNITFFLEKGEIGGNQVLLSSRDGSIWLDFGLPLKKVTKYINLILEGRQLPKMNLNELSKMKIVPPPEYLGDELSVLVSHAHLDHYGALFAPLEHDIKVQIFAPEDTLKLIKARMEISAQSELLKKATLVPCSKGCKSRISGFEVVPIEVDHSIDASYSYLIFTPEGESVFYTGDFRFDLISSDELLNEILKHTDRIDVLITELTGVYHRDLLREQDVEQRMKNIKEKFSGLVVIFSTPSYTKRMQAIRSAFSGRELIVDSSYAYLLNEIGKDDLIDKVLITKKKKRLKSWEKDLQKKFDVVDESYVKTRQKDVVVILAPHHKLRLDFKLEPRSVAVISLSEPFDEESFLFQSKLEKFLLEWRGIPVYQIHASGHAEAFDIANFVEKLKPQDVYVIHSPNPEVLSTLLPYMRNIHAPTYGEEKKIHWK